MSPRVRLVSTDNLHYKQGVELESSGKEKSGEGLMKNGSCVFYIPVFFKLEFKVSFLVALQTWPCVCLSDICGSLVMYYSPSIVNMRSEYCLHRHSAFIASSITLLNKYRPLLIPSFD